jgi:hypothetical protein
MSSATTDEEEAIMLEWKKPRIEEVKMDAEIGSYNEDQHEREAPLTRCRENGAAHRARFLGAGAMNVQRTIWAAGLSLCLVQCGDAGRSYSSSEAPTGSTSEAFVKNGIAITSPDPNIDVRTGQTSTLVNVPGNGGYTAIVSYDTDFMTRTSLPSGPVTPKITYSGTSVTICPGANRVGYTEYYPSSGVWGEVQPGWTLNGIPAPDTNWPVFWGTTSLGQEPGTFFLYLATLAIPSFKMPKDGSCITTTNPASLVGGACILRSYNTGPAGTPAAFTLSDSDCLHNPMFDAYDATEVVGTSCGQIYAAFHDPVTQQIDFYAADSPFDPFVLQSPPFPGAYVTEAPRMVDDGRCGVHLIAGGKPSVTFPIGEVFYAEFVPPGPFGGSSPAANQNYWGNKTHIQESPGVSGQVRLRAQYDIAQGPSGSVYVAYVSLNGTLFSPQGTALSVAQCFPPGPTGGCVQLPNWTYVPPAGTNVFNPSIASVPVRQAIGPTLLEVKATWLQNTPSQGVFVYSADLGDGANDGSGILNIRTEAGWDGISGNGPNLACPTHSGSLKLGLGAGDWDWYDEHLGVYQPTPSSYPTFLRAFPDSAYSTIGPCTQAPNTSSPVGTSVTWILSP